MLRRFIYEMWEQLGKPDNINCTDLYFAFVDANIFYKGMNINFDDNLF